MRSNVCVGVILLVVALNEYSQYVGIVVNTRVGVWAAQDVA